MGCTTTASSLHLFVQMVHCSSRTPQILVCFWCYQLCWIVTLGRCHLCYYKHAHTSIFKRNLTWIQYVWIPPVWSWFENSENSQPNWVFTVFLKFRASTKKPPMTRISFEKRYCWEYPKTLYPMSMFLPTPYIHTKTLPRVRPRREVLKPTEHLVPT